MSAEPFHDRGPCWRIMRAMERELQRQRGPQAGKLDWDGKIDLAGTVDLSVLAHVTEAALRKEFGTL